MRNKKVYVNRGDEAYISVIFVPDEFTADASGAKEARDLGMFVEEKPVIVGQECISVMPIEQVVRFGQKALATPRPAIEGCEWHSDDNGTWMSACGKEWYFEDSGPEDNGMNYCVKCGKPCIEIGNSEDGGEDHDNARRTKTNPPTEGEE